MKNRTSFKLRVEQLEHRLAPSVTPIPATSSNWSGYDIREAAGTVTKVVGSWTVPAAGTSNTNTYSAAWIGIDGDGSSTVEQIGTSSDYSNWNLNTGQYDNVPAYPQYYAWVEMYPDYAYLWTLPSTGQVATLNAGDSIQASVSYGKIGSKNGFQLDLVDLTTKYDYKATFTYSWGNFGTLNLQIGIPDPVTGILKYTNEGSVNEYLPAKRSSAEWIQEAPSDSSGVVPLTAFGPALQFTGAQATISGVTGPIDGNWVVNSSKHYGAYRIDLVSASGLHEDLTSGLTDTGSGSSRSSSFTVTFLDNGLGGVAPTGYGIKHGPMQQAVPSLNSAASLIGAMLADSGASAAPKTVAIGSSETHFAPAQSTQPFKNSEVSHFFARNLEAGQFSVDDLDRETAGTSESKVRWLYSPDRETVLRSAALPMAETEAPEALPWSTEPGSAREQFPIDGDSLSMETSLLGIGLLAGAVLGSSRRARASEEEENQR